ncbi:MAG: HEAT repeat domain-containing protein, partial [Terriglobales bacterium]
YNPFWTPRQRRHALLGEGFADFYGQVTDLLVKHYSLKDPEILRVLALGAYVPGSRMAYILAGQGSRVAPYILELWRRGPDYNRPQAIAVFGFLLLRRRAGTLHSPLSPTDRRLALGLIRRGARSPDYGVRESAVIALGQAGTSADLPLLHRIAATDSVCKQFPHPPNICSEARRSVRQIRRRAAAARHRQRHEQ